MSPKYGKSRNDLHLAVVVAYRQKLPLGWGPWEFLVHPPEAVLETHSGLQAGNHAVVAQGRVSVPVVYADPSRSCPKHRLLVSLESGKVSLVLTRSQQCRRQALRRT